MFYCQGVGGGGEQAAIGTAAAMQWQSQVSSLMLTVSHGLIHRSAFRTLAYIYKQLTLAALRSCVIPLSFSEWDNSYRAHAEQRHFIRHWTSSVVVVPYEFLSILEHSFHVASIWSAATALFSRDVCCPIRNITHDRIIFSLNSCFRDTETVAPSEDQPLIPSWLHARHS